MKRRPIQYFSKEYLESCKTMTAMQILEFEENFQKLLSLQQQYRPRRKGKNKMKNEVQTS